MAKAKKEKIETEQILEQPIQEPKTPTEDAVETKAELPQVNIEESLLNYIENHKDECVKLNDFFEKIHAEKDDYMAAKHTKQLLVKLGVENKIKMFDTNWNHLYTHYYDLNGMSKKYLIPDVKILAKK
jgi:hypothetical protein